MSERGHEPIAWACQHAHGLRVLHVDCGTGELCRALAQEGFEACGVDANAAAIEAARRNSQDLPDFSARRLRFELAELSALRDAGPFDTIVLDGALERRGNRARLLETLSDLRSEGGRLVLLLATPGAERGRAVSLAEMVELLGAEGWHVAVVEAVDRERVGLVATHNAASQAWSDYPPTEREDWLRVESGALRAATERIARAQADLATRISALEQSAAQARDRALAQQLETQRERAHRDADRAAHADQLAQLRAELARHVESLTALSGRAAVLEAERQELRRMQTETEHEIELSRIRLEREQKARRVVQQKRAAAERSLELERRKAKRLEGRVGRLEEQVANLRAQLVVDKQGVRYRVGDAFVRAARSPLALLKLPLTLAKLFAEGRRRERARVREQQWELAGQRGGGHAASGGNGAAHAPTDRTATAPRTPAGLPQRLSSQTQALALPKVVTNLIPAFAPAPREQIVRPELKIAAVTDEFSWRAWQYEADLYTCTPEDWRAVLEERRPDVLLIESTWGGIDRAWHFQVRDLYQRPDQIDEYALPELVAWCRERDIPTVFYNKEDPPNFEVFIDAAQEFDFVFTSDANCIEDYQRRCKHERVFALPFAAQPRIHHPVLHAERAGSVCFAGTWYTHRHFKRQEAAHCVLRPALEFGLEIFDRMHGSGNDNYRWPDEYLAAVRGGVPYAQMLELYKRYKVFMNINSVTDSPTMFSRRVFELLASGTPVISSHSDGIANILGEDLVALSEDEQTTRAQLKRLLEDDDYRERLALRGQRAVFSQHTYTQRLETILNTIGVTLPPTPGPTIAWIALLHDEADVLGAWTNFNRQQYPGARLVGVSDNAELLEQLQRRIGDPQRVQCVKVDDERDGAALARAVAQIQADWLAALRPSDHYGEHYLTDYAHASRYIPTAALGKAVYYAQQSCDAPAEKRGDGAEYRVGETVSAWTLCVRHETAARTLERLAAAERVHDWWAQLAEAAGRVYSSDRFNYVQLGDPARSSNGDAGASCASGEAPRAVTVALA